MNGFGGKKIPGFATSSWTRDHQKERALIFRQMDGKGNDACFSFTSSACIPDHAMVPRPFGPSDFPAFLFAAIGTHQMVANVPAYNKTKLMIQSQGSPGTACKPTVPQVNNLPAP